ncbi:hypothetical protein JHK85_004872 [Glycine max]|nr:hypothetical protein JHK85_004872 [Glycine max]
MEEEYIEELCMQILKFKPDLVITEKGLSDFACHFLSNHGLSAIRRLRKTDNNRIAKACGAVIVNRPDELQESDVGTGAGLFEVKKIGDEFFAFIEGMPKGIENLIRLRVLKGFVLGSSSKTPCRNIRSCEFEIPKAIQHTYSKWGYDPRLKVLSKLEHFKISWDVFDTRYTDIQISFPSSLKKLHLEGFPDQNIPEA